MESMLLRPEQAAEWLNIGLKVYELMRSGQLQSVQIGACRRIPKAALIDYVDGLRVTVPTS